METNAKYEFTEETIERDDCTLYRIKALISGTTRVCGDAQVFGGARIKNIWAGNNTKISDGALIFDWTGGGKNED